MNYAEVSRVWGRVWRTRRTASIAIVASRPKRRSTPAQMAAKIAKNAAASQRLEGVPISAATKIPMKTTNAIHCFATPNATQTEGKTVAG